MSFVQVNLGADVKEKECAPESEYDLVINDFRLREKEYENGKGYVYHIFIGIEGTDVRYKSVRHYIPMPREQDDEETRENKSIQLKRFLVLFQIPFNDDGFEEMDMPGARCTARLTIESDEDGEYEPQNRLVVPRMKSELDEAA